MTVYRKQLTAEQALQKLRHYCAYQERCHHEVEEKLYNLDIGKAEHDKIITSLIEEDYLNEERFAIAYAGGKFRMKRWGKAKIKDALKQKRVSEYSINKAMKQIKENEYSAVLKKLAEERYTALKEEQWLIRKKKTFNFLLQKGYEADLVTNCINEIMEK